MDFLEFVQRHWGKAGCSHCGKTSQQKLCACHYAMYCGVECQNQDWTRHALICGKGDKREPEDELEDTRKLKKHHELPSFEKKYPKEILDLLVPFMEGNDLKDFSEAMQAGMVAYRHHVAKNTRFSLHWPRDILMSLSPWITRLQTGFSDSYNHVLKEWPAKHLIQELNIFTTFIGDLEPWLVANIAEFNNLKIFTVGGLRDGQCIAEISSTLHTLTINAYYGGPIDLKHLVHLENLTLHHDGVAMRAFIHIARPLKKLYLFGVSVMFEQWYPVEKLYVTGNASDYPYPLTGCVRFSSSSSKFIEARYDDICNSDIRVLWIMHNRIPIPRNLQRLDASGGYIESLPLTLTHLKLRSCRGEGVTIPPNVEKLDIQFMGEMDFNVTSLGRCRKVTLGNSMSMANIYSIFNALNPSVVQKLYISTSHRNYVCEISNIDEFSALEHLYLYGNVILSSSRGIWNPPQCLETISFDRITVDTVIDKLPRMIKEVLMTNIKGMERASVFLRWIPPITDKGFVMFKPRLREFPRLRLLELSDENTVYNTFTKMWVEKKN